MLEPVPAVLGYTGQATRSLQGHIERKETTHTGRQFRTADSPIVHVFGLWGEVGISWRVTTETQEDHAPYRETWGHEIKPTSFLL